MRKITFIILISTISYKSNSQNLIGKTDSIVSAIEGKNNVMKSTRCDTVAISHVDYWGIVGDSLYHNNNNLLKIVSWTGILTDSLASIELSHKYIFYFNNDTLIKAVIYEYRAIPCSVEHYYFSGTDLSDLRLKGLESTDKYRRIDSYHRMAYGRLSEFKRGQIK